VITAENGRDALDKFRKSPGAIVVVVLDLTMPHMDGEETFRELLGVRSDVTVILSSGYSEQEVTQRFAGKGLAGFIQKPYNVEELAQELRAVLDRSKG
jgi:DNA-binding response OmpR family regulator